MEITTRMHKGEQLYYNEQYYRCCVCESTYTKDYEGILHPRKSYRLQ